MAARMGWGGVVGTYSPVDHMCLECADVSFGAPAGPYIPLPPSKERALRPLPTAEEETEVAELLVWVVACCGQPVESLLL